ncbi:MAG: hypothetical protein MJ137_06985, partial [Clostridia bacterium]|nr:hypothetical protein [Clostridia bacterium]
NYGADEIRPPVEAPFNASLAVALRAMADICRKTAAAASQPYRPAEPAGAISVEDIFLYADYCEKTADSVTAAVRRVFRREDGFFRSFSDRESAPLTVLTQSMCVLCGAADTEGDAAKRIADAIAANGSGSDSLVPATISMACFRYDALLKLGGRDFIGVILDEIDRDGKYMLDRGATAFWETLKGDADFSNAGSLCHGWSAMAAYYYALLIE